MSSLRPWPLVVVILDGWGVSLVEEGNAIAAANTPMMDRFALHYPLASLSAASLEVGLPWGEVGNSETGHGNIGAGRVQYQTLPHIDKAIADGEFFTNRVLLAAVSNAKKNRSSIHLMGLLGTGGVHAHSNHLFALLKFLAQRGFRERVYLHLFTDGRDAPPHSAVGHVQQLEEKMGQYGVGQVATVTGRLYAMDRNANWERTQATYELLVGGAREAGAATALEALQSAYDQGGGDETLPPTAITRGGGPIAKIADNDAVIFFNFRPDRARQLTAAFIQPDFAAFPRSAAPKNLYFATMTQYAPELPGEAIFVQDVVDLPLAQVLSEAKLRQLHMAETEKYAHVTYYLNGGHEEPWPLEKHVLVQSSSTKNFADEPHMAAEKITARVLAALQEQLFDVYFINYANADMVGHTGNLAATIQACNFVDGCLNQLFAAIVPAGGILLVTSDHGNAEEMINLQTGEAAPDHTSNPVPLHLVAAHLEQRVPKSRQKIRSILTQPIGVLSDVAPTILDILHLPKPPQMTGISLLPSLQ